MMTAAAATQSSTTSSRATQHGDGGCGVLSGFSVQRADCFALRKCRVCLTQRRSEHTSCQAVPTMPVPVRRASTCLWHMVARRHAHPHVGASQSFYSSSSASYNACSATSATRGPRGALEGAPATRWRRMLFRTSTPSSHGVASSLQPRSAGVCGPRSVWAQSRSRSLSTVSLVTADTQLDAFAEAKEAQALVEDGRGSAAASLLLRVVDICEGATGSSSDLTLAAQRRYACCRSRGGTHGGGLLTWGFARHVAGWGRHTCKLATTRRRVSSLNACWRR